MTAIVFKRGLAIASALQVESIKGEEEEGEEEHFLTSFLVGLVRRLSVGARLELARGPSLGAQPGPERARTSPDEPRRAQTSMDEPG